MLFGVDVSHYQPTGIFRQVVAQGAEFAFIKATEGGSYTDPKFGDHLADVRGTGKLAAAYFYQRAQASPQQHVDRILAVVPKDVPVIPDVEKGSGDLVLTSGIAALLRAHGYRVPLLYLPRWYWQQIGQPNLGGMPPLWSSRYPDTNPGSMAANFARVPASYWDGYGGGRVAVLQFSSQAKIGNTAVDANAFQGTRDQLAALLGYSQPAVAPTGGTRNDEETEMLVPAGTNEHVVLPCAGRPLYWYLYAAFGHKVVVHQCAYVMPTVGDRSEYAGGGWDTDWTFDPDRPGPIGIPRTGDGRQPVGIVLRYTADHSFTLYCG